MTYLLPTLREFCITFLDLLVWRSILQFEDLVSLKTMNCFFSLLGAFLLIIIIVSATIQLDQRLEDSSYSKSNFLNITRLQMISLIAQFVSSLKQFKKHEMKFYQPALSITETFQVKTSRQSTKVGKNYLRRP